VSGPLVLIVDDNEKNRKLTRDVLAAAGFRTLEAATAAEGIAHAETQTPDVVLMDFRLPDMNGAAAARKLADGPAAATRVVALTSLAPEELSASERSAFAGYLQKPIDIDVFPEQVRSYCRS
jgi:two-component system, cell cycle response regulator DivK